MVLEAFVVAFAVIGFLFFAWQLSGFIIFLLDQRIKFIMEGRIGDLGIRVATLEMKESDVAFSYDPKCKQWKHKKEMKHRGR